MVLFPPYEKEKTSETLQYNLTELAYGEKWRGRRHFSAELNTYADNLCKAGPRNC